MWVRVKMVVGVRVRGVGGVRVQVVAESAREGGDGLQGARVVGLR